MYYGTKPHVSSPNDRTLLHCFCGWTSEELTREQLRDRGIPWYCDACGKSGLGFVHFHPMEREAAYRAYGVQDRLQEVREEDEPKDQESLDRIG